MDVYFIKEFLLLIFIVNMVLMLIWFIGLSLFGDWVYKIHSKWFKISREEFDSFHYKLMAIYKTTINGFVLVPLIALYIMEK